MPRTPDGGWLLDENEGMDQLRADIERLLKEQAQPGQDVKYRPDQDRDYHGRWTDEGEGSGQPKDQDQKLGQHLLDELMSDAHENGFTYNPHTGKEPKVGKMISIYPGDSEIIPPGKTVTGKMIMDYLKTHKTSLAEDKLNCMGGWLDKSDGTIYLDVSRVFKTDQEAFDLSIEYKQRGWFDLKTKSTIYTVDYAKEHGLTIPEGWEPHKTWKGLIMTTGNKKAKEPRFERFNIPSDLTEEQAEELAKQLNELRAQIIKDKGKDKDKPAEAPVQ